MVVEYVEKAWNAYTRNLLTVVAASFVAALIPIAILLVTVLLSGLALLPALLAGPASVLALLRNPLAMLGPALAVFALGAIVAALVGVALSAGMIKVYQDSLSRKADLEALFRTASKKALPAIGAKLVAGIIMLAGSAVVLLAFLSAAALFVASPASGLAVGIVAAVMLALLLLAIPLFSFPIYAVVIDNLGAIAAVKKSVAVARKNYVSVLLLDLFLFIASFIVGLVPALGAILDWLVVGPVFGMALAALYTEKRRK